MRIEGRTAGRIAAGFLLLTGFHRDDTADTLQWMAEKVLSLRLFGDADGKMNLGLDDIRGDLLVVSQFTLYGDAKKGRRPSFIDAAPPDQATDLYEKFVALLKDRSPGEVATGEFGAHMEVDLVNDGPVTLILER